MTGIQGGRNEQNKKKERGVGSEEGEETQQMESASGSA